MSLAAEMANAVNALPIITAADNYPDAYSLQILNKHTTDQLKNLLRPFKREVAGGKRLTVYK